MRTRELDINDDEAIARLWELKRVAHARDHPDRPPDCAVALRGDLRHPRPGTVVHHRMVHDHDVAVAYLRVTMSIQENLHLAMGDVLVRPEHRRRGIGSALLAEGLDIARRSGRTTFAAGAVSSWQAGAPRGDAGMRFLEAHGFTLALTEVVRRADLTGLDPVREQRLYDEAAARASGYELVCWQQRVPEELLPGVSRLASIFLTEAPTGDLTLEAEHIDPDLQRRRDDVSIARGIYLCGVAARHRDSGEIVAHTVIGVPTEPGDVAQQRMTLVAPDHRGHRLGLLIKLANHRQLLRQRPGVRWIYTANADTNEHMVAINDLLGYEVVDATREYQRAL